MEQFKHHVSQHRDGTYSLGISIDQGYMTPEDFITLSDLAKKYGVTTLMATTAKKISFMDVKEENVNPLWEDLEQAFGSRLCFPKGKVIVCPGSRFCKFATPGRDNHAIGREVERISKAHDAGKVKVGVSCCPLGCAMPRVRDLGILATARGWMLTIGGNGGAKPGVGEVIAQDLTEEELLALLDKVYQYFQENKNGKERTIRTVERLGLDHLKAAVLK
ncbi:MAG: hypothetical protein ACI3U1_08610 [Peptococcaceae bacterium]